MFIFVHTLYDRNVHHLVFLCDNNYSGKCNSYNVLKFVNSVAPCCESYFYFLLIEVPTSRYSNWPITDVALLKQLSYGLENKNRFQKFIVWRDSIYEGMLLLDHPLLVPMMFWKYSKLHEPLVHYYLSEFYGWTLFHQVLLTVIRQARNPGYQQQGLTMKE